MHQFWNSIIRPCIELLEPRSVVEVGMDSAQTTRPLTELAAERGFTVHSIDPDPKIDAEQLTREFQPNLLFHRGTSLDILPTLHGYECVLIDGDHNWYTVIHELRIIAQHAKNHGTLPLVILHDVTWPYARRDLYYEPERIPETYRHPWKKSGIDIKNDTLMDAGFNAGHSHAVSSQDARNGVRTAIEDFQTEEPGWVLDILPGFFGLGILAPAELYISNPSLRAFINRKLQAATEMQDHIESLEQSRIQGIVLGEQVCSMWNRLQEREVLLKTTEAKLQKAIEKLIKTEATSRMTETELRKTTSALLKARQESAHLSGTLARMNHTLSWRITKPLRLAGPWLRYHVSGKYIFSVLKLIWITVGEPFPHAVRFVRHQILKGPAKISGTAMEISPAPHEFLSAAAVVIHYHDNEGLLRDALESVFAQSHKPAEIVIIDQTSAEDAAVAAHAHADRDIRILRGEWSDSAAARNAAVSATTSPYLMFLDEADMLHPEYLRCGARILEKNPDAGIAYADQSEFGSQKEYYRSPEAIQETIPDALHLINPAAMLRRQAVEQAGGWKSDYGRHADRVLYRQILQLGWRAMRSGGLHFHRVHDKPENGDEVNQDVSYAEQAGLYTEPVTMCLSLSGRRWAWPLMQGFLERQTYPHHLIHLFIIDTSQDAEMEQDLRRWLAHCDYPHVTYRSMNVGIKGVADLPREQVAHEIGTACSTIYNAFARMAETPLVFILEDDVIPPDDAFPRLIRSFEPGVISVSGLYWHRDKPKPICWDWNEHGIPVFPEPATGVQNIGGTGFGCLVIRGEIFRQTVFQAGPPFGNYDHNFFAALTRDKHYRALVDWDCLCRHYQSPDTWF